MTDIAPSSGGDLGLQTNALLMHVLPTALRSYSDRVVEQLLDWPAHSAKLEQRGRFRRYYRTPLSKFSVLAAALRAKEESFFAVGAQHSVSWATAPFSAELRLSMTLRYLAGGSYMDIALHHGCGFNAVHPLVYRTLKALNELPQLDMRTLTATSPRRRGAQLSPRASLEFPPGRSLAASVRWWSSLRPEQRPRTERLEFARAKPLRHSQEPNPHPEPMVCAYTPRQHTASHGALTEPTPLTPRLHGALTRRSHAALPPRSHTAEAPRSSCAHMARSYTTLTPSSQAAPAHTALTLNPTHPPTDLTPASHFEPLTPIHHAADPLTAPTLLPTTLTHPTSPTHPPHQPTPTSPNHPLTSTAPPPHLPTAPPPHAPPLHLPTSPPPHLPTSREMLLVLCALPPRICDLAPCERAT